MQTTKRNDQPKPILPPDLQQALRDAATYQPKSRDEDQETDEERAARIARIERIDTLTDEAAKRGFVRPRNDRSRLQELRQQCAERRAPQ